MNKGIEIFVVYFDTTDYPKKYVVRRFVGLVPDEDILIESDSLKEARTVIPIHCVKFSREVSDPAVIVESWI